MKALLIFVSMAALGLLRASASDFAKPNELKEAAVASFKFAGTTSPKRSDVVASSSADSEKAGADAAGAVAREDHVGDVVALDPFEVTVDKIPVVTHKSESPLAKYLESGALYTHEGKKVTTRIVLSPITGFGVSFSW
jgi:hypothetical protein